MWSLSIDKAVPSIFGVGGFGWFTKIKQREVVGALGGIS